MKTRTRQNGVAGLMSRLIHNIKSAALALAALALAAPSAWGAYASGMQWKDGVSGNLNTAGNWTGGKAPASGNVLGFVNSGAGVSYVTNSAAASYQPRFDKGNFVLVASKTLTANNAFHLASSDGNNTGPASVTKYGDVVAKGYLHLAQVANSHAYFTNMTGRLVANDTTTGAHQNGLRLATGQGAEAEFVIQGGYAVSSNGVTIAHGSDSTGRMIINGGYFFSYGNGNGKKGGTNTVAHASNSTGLIEINGGAYTNENWLFVGNTAGATGTIHVKNGTFNQKCTTANSFVVGGARSTASHGYYIQEGGTATSAAAMIVGFANGADGHVFMKGGTLNLNGQNLHVGPTNGGSGEFVQSGGSVNVNMDFNLGRAGAGTLTVSNGTFTVASGKQIYMCAVNTGNATVNLCGGTLVTKHMSMGPGTAVVNFDGGTLKANNTSNDGLIQATVPVNVGPKGGTIDTGNRAITVPAVLASGVSGETDGGMTFKGDGTVTLSGANTYTGATVIDAGTTIQMPAANNLAGNIVVTNATFADCPITVLTLTGAGADASDILSRCSLAADAPDTVELTVDGASVKVVQKASVPAFARLIYDSGTDSWNWEFRDITDAVVPSVDQSALEAGSVTVIFGSTAELAEIGTAPAWVGGWQMASTFAFDPSASASLPAEYTFDAGTVIDLKGCDWTLPDELKSATVDFTVTNSVDATKAVLTVDVASGATFTETHLTLGGNLELRKTGAGTYAMTKDQQHTGGTVVTAGSLTRNDTVYTYLASDAGSPQSLTIENGSFSLAGSNNHLVLGEKDTGTFTIENGTATMDNIYVAGTTGGNGGYGIVNINGGTVTLGGYANLVRSSNAAGAELNLTGGTFETRRIQCGSAVNSTILFNGGTLFINGVTGDASSGFSIGGTSIGASTEKLTIAVAEKGGTIKTTNNDDRIKVMTGVVKADGVAADGGLKIVGGGKLTFTGSLSYTGGTTVEIGTTLVVPDTSLGGGLSVIFPGSFASAGVYTLVTTTGASEFSAADLPDVSAHPFYRAKLSADGKSIQIERVSPSMAVTALNQTTREATIAFEYIDAPISLVVAWGEKDYGNTLTSWPYNKRAILATAVAAGTTSATYTLPEDARSAGTYYRFFLGDEAATPYDEEVEWIQPEVLGAYITTDNVPSSNPQMEMEINLNDRSYETSFVTLFDAGTSYSSNFWTWATADGKIGGRRGGYATFGPFSKTENLHVKFDWAYPSDSHKPVTVNGTQYTHNNFNQQQTITPTAKLRFWHYAHNGNGISELNNSVGYSAYQLYYAKLKDNAGKLQAHFIPVKKGNDYGIYDIVANKLYINKGASGTSFKGGAKVTDYSPVYFVNGQLQASNPRMMGTIELVSRDWARPNENVTLEWSASSVATKLWVAYSTEPISAAPGEFADPSAWSFCTNIASVAANGTSGAYTLGDPLGEGNRYKTMRFILSKDGDTLVPLLVSEPYRTLKHATSITIR